MANLLEDEARVQELASQVNKCFTIASIKAHKTYEGLCRQHNQEVDRLYVEHTFGNL